jgi:hypothetical protein
MTLIVPKDGARLGLSDPHVKSTEQLLSDGAEPHATGMCKGHHVDLYGQVEHRDKMLPQADDKPSRKRLPKNNP